MTEGRFSMNNMPVQVQERLLKLKTAMDKCKDGFLNGPVIGGRTSAAVFALGVFTNNDKINFVI